MSGTSTSGEVEPTAELTLRIPSAKLDDFLAGAKGVGTVTSLSLSHDDVTAQRVDQDARIQALQTSVTRLTEPGAVPLPSGFTGAIHQGWTALLAVLRGVTLAFGFVLPWIPVLVILAAAAFLLLRRLRR
jgi:Ca-activated chloride channel family protein